MKAALVAVAVIALSLGAGNVHAQTAPTTASALAPSVVEGRWIRPADGAMAAEPIWGHADGLRIGLHPLRGPRGLLRVYAPYLKHPPQHVINFIAIEPIRAGQSNRGLSELERSHLDGVRGKRFWSADDPADAKPRDPARPTRGVIQRSGDGVETLRVYVLSERFESGAHVYFRLTFRADRPHEVAIATFVHEDSATLANCIVTATMGNFAQLRQLHLKDRIVTSTNLWPAYRGDGFTPHARFELNNLTRTRDGGALVSATTDEPRPQDATHAPGTREHWRYIGDVATQSWRCEQPDPRLAVLVNGRFTYWASRSPIPNGLSFENFEMVAPFQQGGEFIYSVEPLAAGGGT